MKKIAHCFFMVAIALMTLSSFEAKSQLTPELIGVPEELFTNVENVVFTQKTYNILELVPVTRTVTKNGVSTTTKSYTVRYDPKRSVKLNTQAALSGSYGLNLIHGYLHEFKYSYVGTNDSAQVLVNGNHSAYLVRKGNAAKFYAVAKPDQYTTIENGPIQNGKQTKVHIFHTRAFVDSLCKRVFKYSLDEAEKRCAFVFHGELKDPSTHITSIFALGELQGNEVINKSLVNGKLWSTVNVGSLITSYGKTGVGFKYHYRFLNECGFSTSGNSNDANIGNFGECGRTGYFSHLDAKSKKVTIESGVPFSYNAITHTAVMDNSKKRYVIVYMGGEVVSGKEESSQCYVDLDTGACYTFAQ